MLVIKIKIMKIIYTDRLHWDVLFVKFYNNHVKNHIQYNLLLINNVKLYIQYMSIRLRLFKFYKD